mmetsp:Transcript_85555/g.171287  ORF Transcript_85555/g.171287 Transcript_85555/m.171287 type:complete len:332 (-) Transcript_85555:891-1886(-)
MEFARHGRAREGGGVGEGGLFDGAGGCLGAPRAQLAYKQRVGGLLHFELQQHRPQPTVRHPYSPVEHDANRGPFPTLRPTPPRLSQTVWASSRARHHETSALGRHRRGGGGSVRGADGAGACFGGASRRRCHEFDRSSREWQRRRRQSAGFRRKAVPALARVDHDAQKRHQLAAREHQLNRSTPDHQRALSGVVASTLGQRKRVQTQLEQRAEGQHDAGLPVVVQMRRVQRLKRQHLQRGHHPAASRVRGSGSRGGRFGARPPGRARRDGDAPSAVRCEAVERDAVGGSAPALPLPSRVPRCGGQRVRARSACCPTASLGSSGSSGRRAGR